METLETALEPFGAQAGGSEGTWELSTAQANLFEWKQEVNRRLAEHRSRKGVPAAGPRVVEAEQRGASRRGAEAAARVAQRFAHAPSYRDILIQEPQGVRADESRYAPIAEPAAAEPMAAQFETAPQAAPDWESAPEAHAAAAGLNRVENPIPIHYVAEPRRDGRLFGGAAAELFEATAQEWSAAHAAEEMQAAEAEPIHANLIEFPRELVATRKIRPRLEEGPYATAHNAQLSICEVDPEAISTEAEPANVKTPPDWNQPEWSGIKLDAQPAQESVAAAEQAASAAAAAAIELAPLDRRLLALFVDATLIGAAVVAAGAVFAYNATALPGPREMGFGAVTAFVAAAVLYELMFFTLSRATPGMRYAHIGLYTFGNERPSRKQRQRRLAAMALSVLPVGLGLLWSLFDEEQLCWHDRLSQTYLKESF